MPDSMFIDLGIFLAFLVGAVVSLTITPALARKASRVGLMATDLHKPLRPQIPDLGGVAVATSFIAAMTVGGLLSLNQVSVFVIFFTASLGAIIGLIDDLLDLSLPTHVFVTLLIGVPLIAYRAGSSVLGLTPWGTIDLGVLFWLAVPFITAFLTNSVNIYAGFNGLETGLAATTSIALGVSALIYGSKESAFALLALGGALVGFARWNILPAKILLGNIGTYLIGAVLSASVIVGGIKVAAAIACFPYFVNFLMRIKHRFAWSVGETLPNGLLKADGLIALWAVFMQKPTHERNVVLGCIAIQAVFGALAVIYSIHYALHLI
jgi:UDP-N-acetylglucosamine--dolichyl-phosphate N-acetylglucosaminephosphotransferase